MEVASAPGSSSSGGGAGMVKVHRFEDTNVLVYRTIPLFWPQHLATSRPQVGGGQGGQSVYRTIRRNTSHHLGPRWGGRYKGSGPALTGVSHHFP